MTKRQRALVVGLGISGTASALRLHRAGWDVVVLEKAHERRRGGYFIALFGTGLAAAERLGIADAVPNRVAPEAVSYEVDRTDRRRRGLSYADVFGGSRPYCGATSKTRPSPPCPTKWRSGTRPCRSRWTSTSTGWT